VPSLRLVLVPTAPATSNVRPPVLVEVLNEPEADLAGERTFEFDLRKRLFLVFLTGNKLRRVCIVAWLVSIPPNHR